MLSATRYFAALYLALFLSLLSTLPCAYAAADTKVANRTIERVSYLAFFLGLGHLCLGPFLRHAHTEGAF